MSDKNDAREWLKEYFRTKTIAGIPQNIETLVEALTAYAAALTQERDALRRENVLHENELIKLYEEATHHLKTIALARELFKGSKFFAPIEDALRAAAEESQPK